MVFSSTTFLFVFLPITLVIYYLPIFKKGSDIQIKARNIILCAASLFFYAWGEPVYVFLMLISIYFNFNIGLDIDKHRDSCKHKKLILFYAIIINLGILGFFKYYDFAVETINSIFSLEIQTKELVLPIGISFYTFQIISYIVDVYRGKSAVQKKLINFTCYVSLFPQLIAGPIVQYNQIEKQLQNRSVNTEKLCAGIIFFTRGLCKKVIFANFVGSLYTQLMLTEVSELSVVRAWFAIFCYSLQIYFDFSGYSDMAIGLGRMFGFSFMQNFNFPYTSTSITDFWSRWHISLSLWFKNYVYIPLGGNRKSTKKTILNLLIVWTLTGLWHGASWNFVAWGMYFAVLLILEKFVFAKLLEKIPAILRYVPTMILVMFGWVLFSSETLSGAVSFIYSMFGLNGNSLIGSNDIYYLTTNFFPIAIMSLSAVNFYAKLPRITKLNLNLSLQFIGYLLAFVICIIFLISETYNPFLYFRF